MHEIEKTILAARRIMEERKRGLLVTIVATRGSTYRKPGGRVVISEDGESFGTVSGGCLERDLIERSEPWLADGRPRLVHYDSTRDDDIIFGLGIGCRGTMDLLVEPFDVARPPRLVTEFKWNGREPVIWSTNFEERELLREEIRPEYAIAIFGGGPDVEPVARLAEQVGWRASVVSPKDMHPEHVKDRVDLKAFDAAVVMTHNFLHDLALLSAILPSGIPYVGLLGPKQRGDELLAQIADVSQEDRARLHSPIGLDLGGETPEEIALSIIAEIQSVLNRRSASSLREKDAPIHADAANATCR